MQKHILSRNSEISADFPVFIVLIKLYLKIQAIVVQ